MAMRTYRLHHESFDDSVEDDSIVVTIARVRAEVLNRLNPRRNTKEERSMSFALVLRIIEWPENPQWIGNKENYPEAGCHTFNTFGHSSAKSLARTSPIVVRRTASLPITVFVSATTCIWVIGWRSSREALQRRRRRIEEILAECTNDWRRFVRPSWHQYPTDWEWYQDHG